MSSDYTKCIEHPDAFDHTFERCNFDDRYHIVVLYCMYDRVKIYGSFSQGKMGIFTASIVMKMIMGCRKLQEFCEAVILVRMTHVQSKRGIPEQGKFFRCL